METRGVASAVQAESQQARDQSAASSPVQSQSAQQGQPQKVKIKQPGVSYRATLQKLSNTISLSSAEVLSRYAKSEPSLTLHFHQNHWKFDQQDGIFLYNSQGRQILEAIRNEQIPVDCLEVFRDVKIKYYEGCLILKLIDYRQTPPNVMHTALKPSPESIWTEMLLYSEQTQGNFTDAKALQVESDILVATNPPLDLRPCIHPEYSAKLLNDTRDPPLPRIARKRATKYEDDEEHRLMYMYDEHHGKDFTPDFKRLAFVEAHRRKRAAQQRTTQANGSTATTAAALAQSSNNVNGSLQRASQSPMVQQQLLPQPSQESPAPGPNAIPLHIQQRPSASPQPGARQLQLMNQQVLAQQLSQQNSQASSESPRQAPGTIQMMGQSPGPGQSPLPTNSAMTNDLARQQQLMLQQRAIAIRNINAARQAQAQAQNGGQPSSSSPRIQGTNITPQNGMGSILQGLPNGMQGTPTPMQMQQIRQVQAQQQAQQMAAHAAQQQAAAQQSQMGYSNGMIR